MTTIRLLIADDHPFLRRGLRTFIASDPSLCCIGEVMDGSGILEAIESSTPDLLLLDLGMPNFPDPAEFVRRLKISQPALRVLVLTSYNDQRWLYQLILAGIDGYMLKDEAEETLLQAIHQIVETGQRYITPTATSLFLDRASDAPEPASSDGLTPRELEVLRLVATGYTNLEVGTLLSISHLTARNHVTSILSKVGVRTRTELVLYAIERGWVPVGT